MDTTLLASPEHIERTVTALAANNFKPEVFATKEAALERIKELIPAGASVMNGTSKTLEQIGYIEYLKSGAHPWKNLHEEILAESDPAKQSLLRKQVTADYWLNSTHAVTEKGELVNASASGSQIPSLAFTASNLIFVVSTKKLVPDLSTALAAIDTRIVPQEDVRMKQVYGPDSGTIHAKTLILHKEPAMMRRTVHVLLVEEDLGF